MDDENRVDVSTPSVLKSPPTMTREEWAKHQFVHTSYALGCKHYVVARAIRRQHPRRRRHHVIVPDVDGGMDGPTQISMDYMYLGEKNSGDQDIITNASHLVVVDHRHGRIWIHRVPQKGVLGKAEWVSRRVVQDLCNNGMQSVTIHNKTNQEPAMVNVQTAMQECLPNKIISINNPVGESECNGRIENAIRRVQEKVRALRHQVNSSIKHKVLDDVPIMS